MLQSCPFLPKIAKKLPGFGKVDQKLPTMRLIRGHIRASNRATDTWICSHKINLINITLLKTRNQNIFPHLNSSRLTKSITGKLAINFFPLHLIFTSFNTTPKVRCTRPSLPKEANRRAFSL